MTGSLQPGESLFARLVQQRRSCRAYKPDPVPRGHLEKLLEAARLAPSACNKQPWRLAVVTAAARRQALVRDGFMPGIPMDWALAAPVLVVLGMTRSLVTHRVAPAITGVDYPLLDLGIAGEHIVLQAAELGLGTCWIGWIRPATIRKIVGWGREIEPVSVLSVGWPGQEDGERTGRLPMNEIVTWIEE